MESTEVELYVYGCKIPHYTLYKLFSDGHEHFHTFFSDYDEHDDAAQKRLIYTINSLSGDR